MMNLARKVVETEVLVIGGGVAGARAAVEAHDHGVSVVMVMKDGFGRGGASCVYRWGRVMSVPNGDTDPVDTPEEFFNDIMRVAAGMCDEKLARILAYEAIGRFNDLEKWGLETVVKVDGKCRQISPAFCTRPRGVMTSGLGIAPSIVNLLKQRIENGGIKVFDNVMVVSLLVKDGSCVGALGVDKHGQFLVFKAKSTVLATGGGGAVLPPSGYPADATGDGYAMGFRAGAELANMEFIQLAIHGVQAGFLYLAPDMYNRLGERFLPRYLPDGVTAKECFERRSTHTPFTTSDQGKYIDTAVYKEISEGRGSVYIDFTGISEENLKESIEATRVGAFSEIEHLLDRVRQPGSGFANPLESPLEVTCVGHAFNGGFRINERTETTLPGLYAIGEVATGPHGADRLGGNMIAVSQVFGARAGRFAALRAESIGEVNIDDEHIEEECRRVSKIILSKGNTRPEEIKAKINDVMWRNCLTVRNQMGLESCIQELRRLRNEELPGLSIEGEADIFTALAIPNMLDVGEMVACAALKRKESRGSHYREDYPEQDDKNWLRTINICRGNLHIG